jgi:PAS domain S-box-containing protein
VLLKLSDELPYDWRRPGTRVGDSRNMPLSPNMPASRFSNTGQAKAAAEDTTTQSQLLIDSVPALIHTSLPDGYLDFFNQRWLDYVGRPLEDLLGWKWTDYIHPEDVEEIVQEWRASLTTGEPFLLETRVRRADGQYRWMLHHKVAVRNEHGNIVKWHGSSIDIEERKSAEEALQQSQYYLAEGQRLGHLGSWAFGANGFEYWSPELFRIHGLEPGDKPPTVQGYLALVHPEDRVFMQEAIAAMLVDRRAFDFTKKIVRPSGEIRSVRCVGRPVERTGTLHGFLGTGMDVTEQVQLARELQRREAYLAEAQRLNHTGSFGWKPESGEIVWSDETYRIFEYDQAHQPTIDSVFDRIHPDDRAASRSAIKDALRESTNFEHTFRLLMPDGRVKYVYALHALQDACGDREFVGAVTDITERQMAEEKIREQEIELRQMLDSTPQLIGVFGPDRERLFANRMTLDYHGLGLDEWRAMSMSSFTHPDDSARVKAYWDRALASGSGYELELRLRKHDGSYRWFLARFNPVHDNSGQIIRWYVAVTDIEERKRAEERLLNENIALREEISKASMFEEIVGSSPALLTVLARIAKVAPTASTVLISGETGTGKELVARAIHRRSQRCSRPFVSVNCAAIPRDLIASELFGHEKGAFTGALQRRLGKFELAEGGTLFLDEVGELPAETQIALLRVLQEREFERVGGNQTIRADVRVIAATNRDLQSAIDNGTFRSDLFYRLNVFPVEVPPLRARRDDIPMLVEYFIDRFARQAGKNIVRVDKKTFALIEDYPWPGNIRELQNVIERSVVLCDAETFSVDESWLLHTSSAPKATLSKKPALQEKEIIEAALAEAKGRVSGPKGAASKLGIPSTTLESKIKSLKINKHRFRIN